MSEWGVYCILQKYSYLSNWSLNCVWDYGTYLDILWFSKVCVLLLASFSEETAVQRGQWLEKTPRPVPAGPHRRWWQSAPKLLGMIPTRSPSFHRRHHFRSWYLMQNDPDQSNQSIWTISICCEIWYWYSFWAIPASSSWSHVPHVAPSFPCLHCWHTTARPQ